MPLVHMVRRSDARGVANELGDLGRTLDVDRVHAAAFKTERRGGDVHRDTVPLAAGVPEHRKVGIVKDVVGRSAVLLGDESQQFLSGHTAVFHVSIIPRDVHRCQSFKVRC